MSSSQVESLGRTGKVKEIFSEIGFALFISTIISYILMIFLHIVNEILLDIENFRNFLIFPVEIVQYFLVYVMLRKMPRQSVEKKDFSGKDLLRFLIIGEFIAVLGGFIGRWVAYLLYGAGMEDPVHCLTLESNFVSLFLSTCVFAPIFEELIFRKLFIDILAPYGEKVAIVFTAFCFAIIHGNIFQIFYAFGLGLLHGYIYIKSRKIIYTIAMHFGFNFLGGMVPKFIEEKLPRVFGNLYDFVFIIVAILGMIVLLRNLRKVNFDDNEDLSAKEKYLPMFLNVGTILFMSMCIGFIVLVGMIFNRV